MSLLKIEFHLIQIDGFDTPDVHRARMAVLARSPRYDDVPRKGETLAFTSIGEDVERPVESVVRHWPLAHEVGAAGDLSVTVHLKVSMCPSPEVFAKRLSDWTGAGFQVTAKKAFVEEYMDWAREGDHLTDG